MPTSPAAAATSQRVGIVIPRGAGRYSRNSAVSASNDPGSPSARIAAMSRAFASGATATGRFASPAIRSMIGSPPKSIILDPIPTFTQSFAGSLYAHLQRRDSRARQLRHFLVTQLLAVFEEKRFSQQRIQLIQHALDEFLVLARPA